MIISRVTSAQDDFGAEGGQRATGDFVTMVESSGKQLPCSQDCALPQVVAEWEGVWEAMLRFWVHGVCCLYSIRRLIGYVL